MKNSKQNLESCCEKTKLKRFSLTFKELYSYLTGYGEKTKIQVEIQSFTSPKMSLSTIRLYCANPESIPEKHSDFYIRVMGEILYRAIEKKIFSANEFVNEISPSLESLRGFYNPSNN